MNKEINPKKEIKFPPKGTKLRQTTGKDRTIQSLERTIKSNQCKCCNNNSKGLFYLIEINGMWQTKMSGLVADPNHYDLIKLQCKSDAETICEIIDLISPIFNKKRIVTEHLYL